jgi:hypothetical protein
LWQRSREIEASEDEAERFLDLAAFAEARLDDDERERVAALLVLVPAAAADVDAARALAGSLPEASVGAAVIARASALVGAEIVPFRPRRGTAVLWHRTARWGSLAAAVALASWLGFDLGSTASATYASVRGDDVSLGELIDPASAPGFGEGSRS